MGKGGGGGGTGGGKISYPAYLETIHGQGLDHAGVDTPTSSMVDLVNTALGSSPFSGESAYDPSTRMTNIDAAITAYEAVDAETNWGAHITDAVAKIDGEVVDASYTSAEAAAYDDLIDEEYENVNLPRFMAGYRDINAVCSSAFVVGSALMSLAQQRDKNKYLSTLRLGLTNRRFDAIIDSSKAILQLGMDFEKALVHYTIESDRIGIVAEKEQADTDLAIDVQDAKWDMDTMIYLGNMIAAIAGASTVREGLDGPSTARSMLGGAASGAAAGAMLSPGAPMIGAGIGALVGGLGSLL